MKTTWTAIIVDDEEQNNTLLCHFINQYCPQIEIIDVCTSFSEAYTSISKKKPDILFLDIVLGANEDSFQLLQLTGVQDFKIIFITAYSEHAVQAFRCSAIDYLLKPLKINELIDAVNKITQSSEKDKEYIDKLQLLQTVLLESNAEAALTEKKIPIQLKDKIEFWLPNEIMYLQANLKQTFLYNKNGECFETYMSLSEFEEKLKTTQFKRVHKSYIVNIDYIKSVINSKNVSLEMSNNQLVPVSRRKRSEIVILFADS